MTLRSFQAHVFLPDLCASCLFCQDESAAGLSLETCSNWILNSSAAFTTSKTSIIANCFNLLWLAPMAPPRPHTPRTEPPWLNLHKTLVYQRQNNYWFSTSHSVGNSVWNWACHRKPGTLCVAYFWAPWLDPISNMLTELSHLSWIKHIQISHVIAHRSILTGHWQNFR